MIGNEAGAPDPRLAAPCLRINHPAAHSAAASTMPVANRFFMSTTMTNHQAAG